MPQIEYKYFHTKYYDTDKSKIMYKTKENKKKMIKKEKTIKRYSLDSTDYKLLQILSNNARIDYVSLSKHFELTANGIRERIKRLVNFGIITGFTIIPDKIRLGYEQYNIQFTFENNSKEKEKKLMQYIKMHPQINFYYKPIGHWDLEIGIFVRNPTKLRKIILDMRNKFSDTIKIFDTVVFYEEPKSNYVPEGVFSYLAGSWEMNDEEAEIIKKKIRKGWKKWKISVQVVCYYWLETIRRNI
ncbi:Lrp/AsnC family transcriptional regulator [Candidatus Woesearchaeota archaeon]|nr:Lrp/AsnC family transcriptional regulator [Candidatus Woesearchaeota archaeon]